MRGILLLLGLLLAAGPARAQLFGSGGRLIGPAGLGSDTLNGASPYGSLIPDNRVYIHGFFDQLEGRIGDGTYLRLGRAGLDRQRLQQALDQVGGPLQPEQPRPHDGWRPRVPL